MGYDEHMSADSDIQAPIRPSDTPRTGAAPPLPPPVQSAGSSTAAAPELSAPLPDPQQRRSAVGPAADASPTQTMPAVTEHYPQRPTAAPGQQPGRAPQQHFEHASAQVQRQGGHPQDQQRAYRAPAQTASEGIATVRANPRGAQLTSTSGLRGVINAMGFSLGLSKKELIYEELKNRIRTPVAMAGCYRTAVLNVKGGATKTTTTAVLGSVLASLRADRVLAFDANPDFGNLDARTAKHEHHRTYHDLLAYADQIETYSHMKYLTSVTSADLEVLGGGFGSTERGLAATDLDVIEPVLEKFYNIVISDCGTGLRGDVLGRILKSSTSIIVATNATSEGVLSAVQTIDWLRFNGFEQLVGRMVVVIGIDRPGKPFIELDQVVNKFTNLQRPVHVIPWDPHLAEGNAVDIRLLKKKTRRAYEQLAASVAGGFADGGGTGWGRTR